MNPFTAAWRKLTYHTEHSDPDRTPGLVVIPGRWGARTVYDPRLPGYLDARRVRMVREGLDPIDRALLDADTVALLAATVARHTDLSDPIRRLPARTGS